VRMLAERIGCDVEVKGSRGLPDFLLRQKNRYGFLIGLTFSLCAVVFLSRFVLTIEVTGNQRVPTAVILNQLRQCGVRPGVYGPAVDREQAAQEVLLELEELAWVGINLHGTRLEVIVRETIQPPERIDETGFYHIVSKADGIVTHIEAELGEAVVQEGDTVLMGETLISGTVTIQPPLYSNLPVRTYQTHARGRVWARTWRTLSAVIPLETMVKDYTGQSKTGWALDIFGQRIEIFRNSSIEWPFYDKITSVYQRTLYENVKLPVSLVREEIRGYEPTLQSVSVQDAQELLENRLLTRLKSLVGEDGEILSTRFEARVEGSLLRVSLQAECREEIGREVPGEPSDSDVQSGDLRPF